MFDLCLEFLGNVLFVCEFVDFEVVVHEDLLVNIDEGDRILPEAWDPHWNSVCKLGRGRVLKIH